MLGCSASPCCFVKEKSQMTYNMVPSLGVCILGAMVCLLPCSPCTGAGKSHLEGAVFDKSSPSTRRLPRPPEFIFTELRRVSPDGRYVAQLTDRDAEVGYLIVYRNRPGAKSLAKRDKVSQEFANVNGCVWVPRRGHWLVVSTGGADYGEGMVALWSGSKRARRLLRAKSEDDEGFNVRSISADGRSLVYEHFGINSPDPDDKHNTRMRLLLPRS